MNNECKAVHGLTPTCMESVELRVGDKSGGVGPACLGPWQLGIGPSIWAFNGPALSQKKRPNGPYWVWAQ